MDELIRRLSWKGQAPQSEQLLMTEWLVTNGLGGYASGTIGGCTTRRFHGLLVAALPSPYGRLMMLNHLTEQLRFPDSNQVSLGCEERTESMLDLPGLGYLTEFRLEMGVPTWQYEVNGHIIEKQILMLYRQNSVYIFYRVVAGQGNVRLELRPAVHFRPHEAPVSETPKDPYVLSITNNRYELNAGGGMPPLRMMVYGEQATFTSDGGMNRDVFYRIEASRGYESRGILWTPGYFAADLSVGSTVALIASTDAWHNILALLPEEARAADQERRQRLLSRLPHHARTGFPAELVLAADQFIITPLGRTEDAIRARAAGDEIRSVIAGYHWFTDWGRDTMISLEGLTLSTGRYNQGGWILRTFARYIRNGLIPNLFPEGEQEGLYHTADATLWFFHALNRYLTVTEDRMTLRLVLPKLIDIVHHHMNGTDFGIRMDPDDGLIRQGQEGYQLTWMDAKVDDWVVTPRRGKAVEINALWYNALSLLAGWVREEQGSTTAQPFSELAERVYTSFNERFWYEEGKYLYDVIDGEHGDDLAFRPNQLLAISLHYPVLERSRWQAVLEGVRDRLLTPVGLRSLAPGHRDYKPTYFGDLRARDAAYHQGTVWGWLIGPFIDAWLKVYPEERTQARRFLEGFIPHLSEGCVGSINEIFDAEAPFVPRGCIAQAWSVAEVLRCWLKTEERRGHEI